MTDARYTRLLEPGQIGKVKTKNRIYKTAAGMMSFDENETHMNDNSLGFYEAIARGGTGLISVEAPTIDYPHGTRWRERYRMDDDRYIPGMAELVDVIHGYGVPTFMQMEHDGPWQSPLFDNAPATFEGPPIAASPVNIPSTPDFHPGDFHRDLPRALEIPEIQDITSKYIAAAERAQKAGFDGVDINAASSHIIHNFLSPFWNRRTDEYGGTHEKRMKLLLDILTGIKGRCGGDFAVVVCLNGLESGYCIGVDDRTCLTHELARETMLTAVDSGADAIMVRSQWLGLHVPGFLPDYMYFPEASVPADKMPPQYYGKEEGRAAVQAHDRRAQAPRVGAGHRRRLHLARRRREAARRPHGRLHRHEPASHLRPPAGHQAGRGAHRRHRRVQPLRQLPRPVRVVPPPLPRERRGGLRLSEDRAGAGPQERRRRRRRPLGHGSGQGRGPARPRRDPDRRSRHLGGLLPLASLIKGTELEEHPRPRRSTSSSR